ncbi:MAG: hypothetical protein IT304_04530 [Dehalococcoidia bacterium]|nr:hypothetical protein [Dehalococcoidia bacterium]
MTVARYGVWLALATAVVSAWLGQRAGASLDFAVLRSVFVFVVVAALGFGAEAVLTVGWRPEPPAPAPRPAPPTADAEKD